MMMMVTSGAGSEGALSSQAKMPTRQPMTAAATSHHGGSLHIDSSQPRRRARRVGSQTVPRPAGSLGVTSGPVGS